MKIFNLDRKGQSTSRSFAVSRNHFEASNAGYLIQEKNLGQLFKATSIGDTAKVQQLLLRGKHNVNDTLDKVKRRDIMIAVRSESPGVVSFLLEYDMISLAKIHGWKAKECAIVSDYSSFPIHEVLKREKYTSLQFINLFLLVNVEVYIQGTLLWDFLPMEES